MTEYFERRSKKGRGMAQASMTGASRQRNVSVYDGTTLIGSVIGIGQDWRALDSRGNVLPGNFKSAKAAVSAVNLSCPSPRVADARMDGSG